MLSLRALTNVVVLSSFLSYLTSTFNTFEALMTSSTDSNLIGTGVTLGFSEDCFEIESILTISFSLIFTTLFRDFYLTVDSARSYDSISFKFEETLFLFDDYLLEFTKPEISPLPLLEEMLVSFAIFRDFFVGFIRFSNELFCLLRSTTECEWRFNA
jgi:hypothetical protein